MNIIRTLFVAASACVAAGAQAVLISDDLIGNEHLCVGFDCVNGESFVQSGGLRPDIPVKLKENNLRLTFTDTTASESTYQWATAFTQTSGYYMVGGLGKAWAFEANESGNGGVSQMVIGRFPTLAPRVLSDGTAKDYACSFGAMAVELEDPVPAGQPATSSQLDQVTYQATGEERCLTIEEQFARNNSGAFYAEPVIRLLPKSLVDVSGGGDPVYEEAPSAVLLGIGSTEVAGAVSVGAEGKLQRLSMLAEAVNELEVVTRDQLAGLPFAAQKAALVTIAADITALEARVAALEVEESGSSKGGPFGLAFFSALLFMLAALRRRVLA